MEWQIIFYKTIDNKSPIEEWIDELDDKTQAKIFRNIMLLKKFALNVREPFVKPLGDKLYELRTKDNRGIYRIIYFAHTGKKFVLLNGFVKKTQKTPRKEIELAYKRMMEVIENG